MIVREDVDAILSGIFDVKRYLVRIADHLAAIRILLGEDDEEAEEG